MSMQDLPKQYEPQEAQKQWYALWLEKGYFHADPSSSKPPYTIVIPPPNVTGALHLGHALNNTIQDILIRWRRMQGYDALWMPGTDHAGIATQAVVEKRIFTEEKKSRHDLGREELVKRIWAWKDEYEARILSQLRLMGCSCDWSRTRFTLDDVCARAVRETFFRLFQADKIFRGKRLVNWDAHLRTAVADDEIEYQDVKGSLWTIAYPVAGSTTGERLHVATTRPETMLGDTAVAVHPEDPRYKHLVGQEVELPLTGRKIPIIGDGILVDPAFGTGCVKVTPAHDPNDYQTGLRHKLPMINLLNPDGTYNAEAGDYAGLDRIVVRKRVVADLEAQGFLVKIDPHDNRVGYSDRSKTPIEPYLSDQWFVRMDELAQSAMDAVTSGAVKIHPERYAKSYLDWLGEKRDWCISRQLWWGHRIPIWYCDENATEAELAAAFGSNTGVAYTKSESGGWLICGSEDIAADALPGHTLTQDPDALDTWFSSALWPHSTLGWPEQTPELAKYYPTSVLSTARDIITLWVARMVIFGQFNMNDVPFKDVFIHPVIQDGKGQRMSKSAGNGIDPVDIIDLYGADALRFTLALSATETQDLRMPVEKMKLPDGREVNTSERFDLGRTFPNKFWNASRLVLMNLEDYKPTAFTLADLPIEDRWILGRLATVTKEVTADLEHFRFAEATKTLRDFTWNDFCDWYLEFVKARLRDETQKPIAQRVLVTMLDGLCRLLHPITPFVTEQVWQALNQVAPHRGLELMIAAESVCIAEWPNYPAEWQDAASIATVESWREKITALRNLRAERQIPPSTKVTAIIVAEGAAAEALNAGLPFLKMLSNASEITITSDNTKPAECAVAVLGDAEVILPLEGLIDKEAEKARHMKTLADLDKQINGISSKLNNEAFLAKAPADLVAQNKAKLAELNGQRAGVAALLGQ